MKNIQSNVAEERLSAPDHQKNPFPTNPAEMADPLAEMARIRVVHVLSQGDGNDSLEGTVEELLEQSLEQNPTAWSETTRNVMRGVVEGLCDRPDANARIRAASETAVLTVARRWGNIVSAGKATVTATREAAGKTGINSTLAAQQASLGAMEGALQAGPIAYPLLQKELSPIVEDFDQVLIDQRRSFFVERAPRERPQIVVFEPSSADIVAPPEGRGGEKSGMEGRGGEAPVEIEMDSAEVALAADLVRQALAEDFDFEEPIQLETRIELETPIEIVVEAPPSPETETLNRARQAIQAATKPPKPSLWQSVKNFLGGLFGKK